MTDFASFVSEYHELVQVMIHSAIVRLSRVNSEFDITRFINSLITEAQNYISALIPQYRTIHSDRFPFMERTLRERSLRDFISYQKLNSGGLIMQVAERRISKTPEVLEEMKVNDILIGLADRIINRNESESEKNELYRIVLKILIDHAEDILRKRLQSIRRALGRDVPGGTFTPSLFQRKAKRKKNVKKR